MANITMSLDDGLIKKVKKIAVERDTTLTGLVRDHLIRIARQDEQRKEEVIHTLSAIMNGNNLSIGEIGWNRDQLHER